MMSVMTSERREGVGVHAEMNDTSLVPSCLMWIQNGGASLPPLFPHF